MLASVHCLSFTVAGCTVHVGWCSVNGLQESGKVTSSLHCSWGVAKLSELRAYYSPLLAMLCLYACLRIVWAQHPQPTVATVCPPKPHPIPLELGS